MSETPRTVPPDPDNPAEVAAAKTPDGEPDGVLLDPESVEFTDESAEDVVAVEDPTPLPEGDPPRFLGNRS